MIFLRFLTMSGDIFGELFGNSTAEATIATEGDDNAMTPRQAHAVGAPVVGGCGRFAPDAG
jgi:hypothetical protein